jgi:hypothetical protein
MIVVAAINRYAKFLYTKECVILYANSVAIVIAAIGNVNAHHDIKNLIFKKFLYIKANKNVKNRPICSKNCANKSNSPDNLKYAIKPIAGGAIRINRVGINLIGN